MNNQGNNSTAQRREPDTIDLAALLADFWRGLKKLWWLVLLLTAAGAAAFWIYVYIVTEPVYESSATFTVGTGNDENYSFYYSESTADQLSKTFPYILESSYFQSVLLQELGTDTLNGIITSETVTGSNMVTMTVQSPEPEDALAILRAALEVYPNAARYVLGTIQFHMIDEPELPTSPANQPQLWRTLARGGLAGIVVSCGILFLLGLMRKTVRTQEELKKITNLRCLSVMPAVHPKARRKEKENYLSVLDRKTPFEFSESIRALQLRLERAMNREGIKVLMVTSVASGEGKSTIAVNLAEAFAARGKKTLLIDGDLRKNGASQLIRATDYQEESGRKGSEKKETEENEKKIGGFQLQHMKKSGIWLLSSDQISKNPAAVLSHENFAKVVKMTKEKMDCVIIDTPPCGIFQDAAILAEYTDAVLFVLKYDFLPKQKIQEGLSFLREDDAQFLGYVFNQCPQKPNEYGYSRYGYYNSYRYTGESGNGPVQKGRQASGQQEGENQWGS